MPLSKKLILSEFGSRLKCNISLVYFKTGNHLWSMLETKGNLISRDRRLPGSSRVIRWQAETWLKSKQGSGNLGRLEVQLLLDKWRPMRPWDYVNYLFMSLSFSKPLFSSPLSVTSYISSQAPGNCLPREMNGFFHHMDKEADKASLRKIINQIIKEKSLCCFIPCPRKA